jgi:Ca-activated chloride channel family protein
MIAFADRPEEVTDFTRSVEDIEGRLRYTVPKGRTALLDAIYLGLNKVRQARYGRKALLIISDGGDNHSRPTESEIKNLVQESNVQIYAIGIYDHYFPTEEERLGPQLLSDIAELTGGRAHSRSTIPTTRRTLLQKLGSSLCQDWVLCPFE